MSELHGLAGDELGRAVERNEPLAHDDGVEGEPKENAEAPGPADAQENRDRGLDHHRHPQRRDLERMRLGQGEALRLRQPELRPAARVGVEVVRVELVQDDEDPSRFVDYKKKANTDYWSHFDPDRMRVPLYQNTVQIAFSLIFLGLYTGAINTINPEGDLDIVEIFLYIFTLGFVCDEASKLWKVGRYYIGFWNVFNSTLYGLLTVSFVMRMIALAYPVDTPTRLNYNELSYDFLAFSAPMFYLRLLLYLDGFRFFGAMLVVLKVCGV